MHNTDCAISDVTTGLLEEIYIKMCFFVIHAIRDTTTCGGFNNTFQNAWPGVYPSAKS